MKKRILVHALLVIVALALTATIAFAALELIETDTRTNGDTTVTWDSRFADLDYALDETITVTVTWIVTGTAEYVDFGLRCPDNNGSNSPGKGSGQGCINFTPRSKGDSVSGEATQITKNDDNSVTVKLEFNDLHTCPDPNVEMGNAHFKLYLDIDMNGDGVVDTMMSYRVNVLVEEP